MLQSICTNLILFFILILDFFEGICMHEEIRSFPHGNFLVQTKCINFDLRSSQLGINGTPHAPLGPGEESQAWDIPPAGRSMSCYMYTLNQTCVCRVS